MLRGTPHHIELYVTDLARSTAFWSFLLESLGYVLSQQWAEGRSYQLGATYVVLVQTETAYLEPPYHRKRVGLNHLAFHGGSRAEVEALTAALRARGVTILYEDRHPFAAGPDYYAVFCEDPDRIKVEVVAEGE